MRAKGFTLIELMVVVTIVAILAALAYPSYQEQVRKSRRADATAALMKTAQVLERCYTEFHKYNDANCPAVKNSNTASLSAEYSRSDEGYYSISATTLAANAFTLQASPTGAQSGDRCGRFTLDHVGRQGVTGDGDQDGTSGTDADAEKCW